MVNWKTVIFILWIQKITDPEGPLLRKSFFLSLKINTDVLKLLKNVF
jgi:membrane protein YdbS with pleckstrin-like domain